MNFQIFLESDIVVRLGWTLLHSLWQMGLVAIALVVTLRVFRDNSPNVRYLICVVALVIATALPIFTFTQLSQNADFRPPAAQLRKDGGLNTPAVEPGTRQPAIQDEFVRTTRSYSTAAADFLTETRAWLNRSLPSLLPFAVLAWLIGVAFFSLRLAGGFSHLNRFRSESTVPVDDTWATKFIGLCELTSVGRKTTLVASSIVQTPIAIGIFKPVIVIPVALFLQLSPRELETIIAHELIHIRRFDPLVNVVQCVLETVFFYHPAVWWISQQVRREREFAADAAVTRLFEDSHITYARALANLEEIRLASDQEMPRYATAANGGNFMQRIQRILKIKTEASSASSAWTAGLALILTSAFLLTIFSFSSSDVVNAQQRSGSKKLAIGFVSIPPVDRTANPPKDSDATARLLIQQLKEHKVPAIGFLQGGMISDGEKLFPVRANIARMWIDAGFEVGLGGFKHVWLSKTPVDEYLANIEKNETVAKQLIGDMGLPPRYFSYPFLNTGKSVEDRGKVEAWLASRGYTSMKYTFDNQEWMYSYAYDMARNDNDIHTMKEIREAYLAYMSKMFDHYEAYSAELFGRDIPQTMVLTPSRLITDTADEFFAMVGKRGYTFITVNEALSDPAYKTKEDFVGDAGISWFERWSMAKGSKLRPEPAVDQDVERVWKERSAQAKK